MAVIYKKPIVKVSSIERTKPLVPCSSMSLGKQILHKIYNGVDEGSSALMHEQFDSEFGAVDVACQHSVRIGNQLIADKFDRAIFKRNALKQSQQSAQQTALSPAASQPSSVEPSSSEPPAE